MHPLNQNPRAQFGMNAGSVLMNRVSCQVRVQGHAYLHFRLPKMKIHMCPDSGLPGQGPRPYIFALSAPTDENTHIPRLPCSLPSSFPACCFPAWLLSQLPPHPIKCSEHGFCSERSERSERPGHVRDVRNNVRCQHRRSLW